LMDVMVCADEVANPKPHPEPVEKAVNLLGADPATTVYVGDSIHDMLSGREAGVRTAAALWGPFGRSHLEVANPDYWLEKPADLVELMVGDLRTKNQEPGTRSQGPETRIVEEGS
jgi:pyrophosphatase PpaX